MKKALITGISGQDGSYLAEYLLELGYRVYGLVRRESGSMRWLGPIQDKIEILYADMRDTASLEVAFTKASPDEVFNLAGQVFVPTSWQIPAETFDINVGGLARLLNIIERHKPGPHLPGIQFGDVRQSGWTAQRANGARSHFALRSFEDGRAPFVGGLSRARNFRRRRHFV